MPKTYAISLKDADPSAGARIIPIRAEVRALRDRKGRFGSKAIILDDGLDGSIVESWRALEAADAYGHPSGLAGLCADIAWHFIDHPSLQRHARVLIADAISERRTATGRIGADSIAIVLDGQAALLGHPFAQPGRCTGLAPRGKGVTCEIRSIAAGSPSGIFAVTPTRIDARGGSGGQAGGDIIVSLRLLRPATPDETVGDPATLEGIMSAAVALDARDKSRIGVTDERWTTMVSRIVTEMDAIIASSELSAQNSGGES